VAALEVTLAGHQGRTVVDAMERDRGITIATKADLQLLGHELTAAMAGLRSELKADIAEV
jgi:hypothetical protein